MSNKEEVNRALMNEIALLSKIVRKQNRNDHHYSGNSRASLLGRNPYAAVNLAQVSKEIDNSNASDIPREAGSVFVASHHHAFASSTAQISKKWDPYNRYKIDRRAAASGDVDVTRKHLAPAPSTMGSRGVPNSTKSPILSTVDLIADETPKKYDIVNKYFLKRRRLSLSKGQCQSAEKLKVFHRRRSSDLSTSISPQANRILRLNNHRIANRVLQRSIHRLRGGSNPVCSFFKQFGRCQRQEHCPFLHVQHISQIGVRKAMKKLGKGLKPTCVFYLRGSCTTINCPFPHVSPEEERLVKEKKKLKEILRKDELKPKRYYEQIMNISADCIPMVVPRNTRPETKVSVPVSRSHDHNNRNTPLPYSLETVSNSERPGKVEDNLDLCRRERLMGKIALLKSRYRSNGAPIRQGGVPAPEFLPFKK